MKQILLAMFLTTSMSACVLDRIESRISNSTITQNHSGKAGLVIGSIVGGAVIYYVGPKIKSMCLKVYNWFKKDNDLYTKK